MRFDIYAANALNISRNKAAELIKAGKIMLDSKICDKPSLECDESHSHDVALLDEIYVGRGAMKLKSFLDGQNFEISGKDALDIGSSTGGFMQILLQKGANSVVGVDVGSDQLDVKLRSDTRVKVYENTDIREFVATAGFELITCDVAFISVIEILDAICKNAKSGALIIVLFKPQFEVGKEAKRNKKGVVTDKAAVALARRKFELVAAQKELVQIACKECEIKGKEGNAEFFYAFNKR